MKKTAKSPARKALQLSSETLRILGIRGGIPEDGNSFNADCDTWTNPNPGPNDPTILICRPKPFTRGCASIDVTGCPV